jgi:hypothetical protein
VQILPVHEYVGKSIELEGNRAEIEQLAALGRAPEPDVLRPLGTEATRSIAMPSACSFELI